MIVPSRKRRVGPDTSHQRMTAAVSAPAVFHLGDMIPDSATGRRRAYPAWTFFAYAAWIRVWSSSSRLDAELNNTPGLWDHLVHTAQRTQAALGYPIDPVRPIPMGFEHYRYLRNLICADTELFDEVIDAYTVHAVADARSIGLLDPKGGGSLSHPDRTRTIYGDGTIVRPIYKRTPDNDTGGRRVDADAAVHHSHDGKIRGNNLVTVNVRHQAPHQRVVLAIGRVDEPGREAATAVKLIQRVHAVAGPGIHAVVYDGAFRGTHHETLMSRLGVVVINKVHSARAATETTDRVVRTLPIGVWTHDRPGGTCSHTIAAVDGALVEIDHDEDGELVTVQHAQRRQIKRARRSDKTYHFTLIATIACDHGEIELLVSPHAQRPGDHSRPDQLRLIPVSDDDFAVLYGLRNDSESLNSNFKRTLLVDRATSLGWQRQLLDLLGFGLLTNSLAIHHHAVAKQARHGLRAVA